MDKFRNKYRIKSNRQPFWDYSSPGRYFLTVCTDGRQEVLGKIQEGKMLLSDFGMIVESEIKNIPKYHCRIKLDGWVVMPNHFHLIITLGDYEYDNCISVNRDNGLEKGNHTQAINENIRELEILHCSSITVNEYVPESQNIKPTTMNDIIEIKKYRSSRRKMLIPKIIGKFQMITSKQMNILRHTPGWRNWQPNYYDHIIRNEDEYQQIYQYVLENPKRWKNDIFCAS